MARALLGHIGPVSEHVLALEIARLRHRVAELEAEVAELRSRAAAELDHSALERELHELHKIAESAEPALA
jgi:hypothetical protein